MSIKTKSTGFTLIELIIYIALVAIFISGAILFAWDAIYANQKSLQQQVVEQNARAILARINFEIRRAADINSVTASSLELENGGNDTTISLVGNQIQITTSGSGPHTLNSNQVVVDNLTFAELSSTNNNSKNVQVELEVSQAAAESSQFSASTTVASTVELNSQFNQARQFLNNLTDAVLSTNRRNVLDFYLENSGSTSITLDQLYIAWTDTPGGENITSVTLNNTQVWSGSAASGSTLDLTNLTLPANSGEIDQSSFGFDDQMDEAEFTLGFIFTDGSIHSSLLSLAPAVVLPSPSPSPSPSPNTCALFCQGLLYSSGTCRANPNQCTQNGEVNQSLGDVFCTGGGPADTCCCAP